jgi:hypothetical protein
LKAILQVFSVLSSAAEAAPAVSSTGGIVLVGLAKVEPKMYLLEVGWQQVGLWLLQSVSLRELLPCLASSFCRLMAISLPGRKRYYFYECPYIGASLIGMPSIWCIGRGSGPLSPSPVHTHTGLTLLQRYDEDTRLIGPSLS